MTLKELKDKTLSIIEEYYPEVEGNIVDDDIKYKIYGSTNQILMELMPYRKNITYSEHTILESDNKLINLTEIVPTMYQMERLDLEEYDMIGDSLVKVPDDYVGTFKIYYYKMPTLIDLTNIDPETKLPIVDETMVLDLDLVLLEIAPYGIAADLLKMDMISGYGQYFYTRYKDMLSNIDSRRTSGVITSVGGYEF